MLVKVMQLGHDQGHLDIFLMQIHNLRRLDAQQINLQIYV